MVKNFCLTSSTELISYPSEVDRFVYLDHWSIRRWFRYKFRLFLNFEFKPVFSKSSSSVSKEAEIPQHSESHDAPRHGRNREPREDKDRISMLAHGRDPRRNNRVRAANGEDGRSTYADIWVGLGLLPPLLAGTETKFEHANCHKKPEDCDKGVRIKPNQ